MDESSIEAGGIEPFLDQIKSISAISSLNDLFSHLGAMERRFDLIVTMQCRLFDFILGLQTFCSRLRLRLILRILPDILSLCIKPA